MNNSICNSKIPLVPKMSSKALCVLVILALFQACGKPISDKDFVMTDIREYEGKIDIDPWIELSFQKLNPERFGPFMVQYISRKIGEIEVTSGKLIVSDGLIPHDIPLKAFFPTGIFPVEISMASWEEGERVAYSRIKFNDNIPVVWYPANFEGSEPNSIDGFSVDTGTGLYIDYANRGKVEISPFGKKISQMSKSLEENQFASISKSGLEFSVFSTGYGDGVYLTYIGYDAQGEVCRLASDFEIHNQFIEAKETYDEEYVDWLISERTKFGVKIVSFEKKLTTNPMKKDWGVRFNSIRFQVIKKEKSDLNTLTIEILRKGSSAKDHNRALCDIDVSNIKIGKWTELEAFAFDMFNMEFETIESVFQPEFEPTSFQAYMKENNNAP